jgi:hypothetical protein
MKAKNCMLSVIFLDLETASPITDILNNVKKERFFAPGTEQRPSREGLVWTCGRARRSSSSCSTPHYQDLGFHSLTGLYRVVLKIMYCEGQKELAHTIVRLQLILFTKITGAFLFRTFGGFLIGAIISVTRKTNINLKYNARSSTQYNFNFPLFQPFHGL